jgi:chitinase
LAAVPLADCLRTDIKTCQSTYGKTILISLGGFTYTDGGFTSASVAQTWANNVWNLYGPNTATANRPFLSAVVDGFDFDFETSTQNMAPFAKELRSLMDAATDKKYYLSAAPQCPYPDIADNDMLNGAVSFDFIMVQYYNNYCGVSSFVSGSSAQNNFNFATWDNWAKTTSLNPKVKVLLGVPGNTGGGGGYEPASFLSSVIAYCKQFSSFGGVMMWDMSQVYSNAGFLDSIVASLGSDSGSEPGSGTTTTLVTTTRATSTTTRVTTTTTSSSSPTGVAQWGQCGGSGYTGSTVCASPYTCQCLSTFWCQCE